LVEPQRTNLALYSEQFNNAAWTTSAFNATVTANTTISPDGTQNADTVVFGANGYLYQQFAIVGLASATFSIYAKSATQIIIFGGGTAVGTDVYTTVNVGNGWFRQILTRTFTGGGTGILQPLPFGNNVTAFLWGCQVETNATYPTSYIPTTSAAVTRNADVISKTGISSLIGQTEGTVFLDYIWNNNASDVVLMQVIGNNGKFFWFRENGVQFYGNGTTLLFDYSPGSATYGQRYKLAFVYGQNDFQLYRDGTLLSSITSGTFSGSFDDIILPPISSAPFDGSIKHNIITLFSTKLTNAECISLTT
jgi:hypothetical protein